MKQKTEIQENQIIFNNILFNSDGIYGYRSAYVSKEFQVK